MTRLYLIGYPLNCTLILTTILHLANSISSFRKFLNYLKVCNPGAACSLIPVELILDDTSKSLPLDPVTVPNYKPVALFYTHCGTPSYDWRYIYAYLSFNLLVTFDISSVGWGYLKPSNTSEKTML